MTVRFILLMPWGRVGSNLLFSILRQGSRMKLENEKLIQIRTAEEQMAWFHAFYEIGAQKPSHTHIGSKQNLRSIKDRHAFLNVANEHGLRIVRLRRANFVKAAVSQIRAEMYADKTARETGVALWAVKRTDTPLGAVAIDPALLLDRITTMHLWHRILMTEVFGPTTLDIEYEEVNADLANVVRHLREFLELPQSTFTVPFVKATPTDLEQAISNFAEVQAALLESPYADLLLA